MPTRCVAAGCSKSTKDGVSLHLFPTVPKYRRIWAAKVKLTRAKWSGPSSCSALCSDHFEPSCFEVGLYSSFGMTVKNMLKSDAIPTKFPRAGKGKEEPVKQQKPRGAFAKREKIRILSEALDSGHPQKTGVNQDVDTSAEEPDVTSEEILLQDSKQSEERECQSDPVESLLAPSTSLGKPSALKPGHSSVDNTTATCDSDKYQRTRNGKQSKHKVDAAEGLLQLQSLPEAQTTDDSLAEEGCKADRHVDSNCACAAQEKLQRLLEENRKMKKLLADSSCKFDRDFFKGNDESVKHYTGLPSFASLDALFGYLEAFILIISCLNRLTKFQQLVLCLMKLRLNLPDTDLGQRFNVLKLTASKIFLHVVDVMHVRLKPLIFWSEHKQLQETMAMDSSAHFGQQTVVIIDCFELLLERPSDLAAQTSTWSSYKSNNTVKYLIGVTPLGAISYLSEGWGGRSSDKDVVEHSGFLQRLCPGDIVIADKGLDIADSIGMMGAKLPTPTVRRQRPGLTGKDVEKTPSVENSRTLVERVVGMLRQKYTILHSTIPIDYVIPRDDNMLLDKITVISCALTNMCQSVVP